MNTGIRNLSMGKLIEYYRKADSDTIRAVINALTGKCSNDNFPGEEQCLYTQPDTKLSFFACDHDLLPL